MSSARKSKRQLQEDRDRQELIEMLDELGAYYMSDDGEDEMLIAKDLTATYNSPAVVIDVGSWTLRSGLSSDPFPREEIPMKVGQLEDDGSGIINLEAECFVGGHELYTRRPGMVIKNCIRQGMIYDWELFEKIMDYVYYEMLSTVPKEHPLLITEPTFNTTSNREELVEMMFENYCVPALCLSKGSALPAFSNDNDDTGIVIDSGETHTSIIPIVNGSVVTNAVRNIPMGGKFVTIMCGHLLRENNIELVPSCMVKKKLTTTKKGKPIWTRKKLPGDTRSWQTFMIETAMEDFKHCTLEVSHEPLNDDILSSLAPIQYQFPNGHVQMFGSERYKILENFFDPIVGFNDTSISNFFIESLSSFSSVSLQHKLLNNIVLCGGNALFEGFHERLVGDLRRRMPEIKGLDLTTFIESSRRHTAWFGGSAISKSSSFPEMCVTRHEYDEYGKAYIHTMCP